MQWLSIVVSSAILPSPNRICKMADNRDYVNYIHLHTQTIPLDSLAQNVLAVAVRLPTPTDWSARGWRRTVG